MGDERTITDCDYFLQGNCRWGEICLFRHPLNLHQPPLLCKYWQSYSCTNVYCKFLHPAVLPPPTKKLESSVIIEGSPRSEKVCAFYMSGRCAKSDCPFMHGLPETVSSRHPMQVSLELDIEKKRNALELLSKYSLQQTVDNKKKEEDEAARKRNFLDSSLDSYHNSAQTLSKFKRAASESDGAPILQKSRKIDEINRDEAEQKTVTNNNDFVSFS